LALGGCGVCTYVGLRMEKSQAERFAREWPTLKTELDTLIAWDKFDSALALIDSIKGKYDMLTFSDTSALIIYERDLKRFLRISADSLRRLLGSMPEEEFQAFKRSGRIPSPPFRVEVLNDKLAERLAALEMDYTAYRIQYLNDSCRTTFMPRRSEILSMIEEDIKRRMYDPESYERLEDLWSFRYDRKGRMCEAQLALRFTGTNAFGGRVQNRLRFKLRFAGDTLKYEVVR